MDNMPLSFDLISLPALWSGWDMEEWAMVVWLLSIAGHLLLGGIKQGKLGNPQRRRDSRIQQDVMRKPRESRPRFRF